MENNGGIGTLQERSLHASIKKLYETPDSQTEVNIDGYIVDVVIDDLLIEIQTRNFSAIKDKLFRLMKDHPIRLVYPIPNEKWLIRQSLDGLTEISRRRSPKQMRFEHLFEELVSIPTYILHHNFSLEVLLTKEEEIRVNDGKGSWRRRGWSNIDRKLIEVVGQRLYSEPQDFLHLIPETLVQPFTTNSLAETIGISKRLAQKMAYCMRKMNALKLIGKEGNSYLYSSHEI
ncbi:hypothetical protein EU527_18390 [Candidatus Thorarchaeota archaeon]|nr:MAG: hypothetical protein EU527_18390 [Candidatus Thorarchaeota archaeon]